MARTKKASSARKPPRLRRVAAHIAGMKTPSKPAGRISRKKGADLVTPSRWKVVTSYFQLLGGRSRLPPGGFEKLKNRFPSLNLNARSIQRLVKNFREQTSDTTLDGDVDLSRQRSACGGHGMKLTVELATKLIETNDRYWGKLSAKKLAGKLTSAGHKCSATSVRTWCKVLGATRRRRYIKPKLTAAHNYVQVPPCRVGAKRVRQDQQNVWRQREHLPRR